MAEEYLKHPCAQCNGPIPVLGPRQDRRKFCSPACSAAATIARREARKATAVASPTKRCTVCKKHKDRAEFHVDTRRVDGLFPYCKPCRRERDGRKVRGVAPPKADYDREYRANMAPETKRRRARMAREAFLWRKYGLTLDAYQRMLEEQGGGCGICGALEAPDGLPLCVDHVHTCCSARNGATCGECVRSLLCASCNYALGHFGDDIERIRAAVAYLERHPLRYPERREIVYPPAGGPPPEVTDRPVCRDQLPLFEL